MFLHHKITSILPILPIIATLQSLCHKIHSPQVATLQQSPTPPILPHRAVGLSKVLPKRPRFRHTSAIPTSPTSLLLFASSPTKIPIPSPKTEIVVGTK